MRWLAIVSLVLLAGCSYPGHERTLLQAVKDCGEAGYVGAGVLIHRIPEDRSAYAHSMYTVSCMGDRVFDQSHLSR